MEYYYNEHFFIVSTPIGNLSDITLRAIEILKNVDIILCEDSRVTKKICNKYDIDNSNIYLSTYNDFSTQKQRENIIKMITQGKKFALVSDAGTPLISDPGFKLLNLLYENKIRPIPIPGASSVTVAASMSPLIENKFIFLGFLPNKITHIKNILEEYNHSKLPLIIFISPHKILKLLEIMLELFGNRQMTICRELTKIHEEIITNDMIFFHDKYQKMEAIKGEFVIVIDAYHDPIPEDNNLDTTQGMELIIQTLLQENYSVKDITILLSSIGNIPKKLIYETSLKLKK